jgi:hypothetical protein
MIYLYDKKQLLFHKPKFTQLFKWIFPIVLVCISIGYVISSAGNHPNPIEKMVYEDRLILITADDTVFSEELFIKKLKQLKVKFPYIAVAQARQETYHYTSNIFLENNNLFGMKMAGTRPTTAIGINRKHALYDNWEDSVIDYAFFQTSFLRKLKTEEQYLDYLNKHYAEDTIYNINLKRHIKETKLLFTKK